ncbi:MAG TPA: hypothetical protein VNH64_05075, partial [Parvularculaceae bacterium]|nr:hypothetical protein [Parvularculaceae bacterium]
MQTSLQRRMQFGAHGFGRAGVILAAFWLAFVQIATVAHAVSDAGTAPNHDQSACVFHIAADRMHAASTPAGPIALPIGVEFSPTPAS